MKSTKEILESILKELEVVRSGEVPKKKEIVIIHDSVMISRERTEDFAKGFTEGKNLAYIIVYDWLDYVKRETQ